MSKQTPEFDAGEQPDDPTREIDVYHRATEPTVSDDEFIRRNNLGLGYYEDSEIWQQLERYADGMFGASAFTQKIVRKAIRQTKRRLAIDGKTFYDTHNMDVVEKEGWDDLSDDEQADIKQSRETSRGEWIKARGEEIWGLMDEADRLEALEIVSGVDEEWTPPHLRILLAQHEMSRSKGARTLDNLFGRKKEKTVISDGTSEPRRLLGGGGDR